MKEGLVAKFTQNQNLKNLLLSTGDKKLVEHTTNDDYWGDKGDGSGRNRLGELLMEVRNEFKVGILHGGASAGASAGAGAGTGVNADDDDDYYKYLKYKSKYVNLKKKLDI